MISFDELQWYESILNEMNGSYSWFICTSFVLQPGSNDPSSTCDESSLWQRNIALHGNRFVTITYGTTVISNDLFTCLNNTLICIVGKSKP